MTPDSGWLQSPYLLNWKGPGDERWSDASPRWGRTALARAFCASPPGGSPPRARTSRTRPPPRSGRLTHEAPRQSQSETLSPSLARASSRSARRPRRTLSCRTGAAGAVEALGGRGCDGGGSSAAAEPLGSRRRRLAQVHLTSPYSGEGPAGGGVERGWEGWGHSRRDPWSDLGSGDVGVGLGTGPGDGSEDARGDSGFRRFRGVTVGGEPSRLSDPVSSFPAPQWWTSGWNTRPFPQGHAGRSQKGPPRHPLAATLDVGRPGGRLTGTSSPFRRLPPLSYDKLM